MKIQKRQNDPNDMRLIDTKGNILGFIVKWWRYGTWNYRATIHQPTGIIGDDWSELDDAVGFILVTHNVMTWDEWSKKKETSP